MEVEETKVAYSERPHDKSFYNKNKLEKNRRKVQHWNKTGENFGAHKIPTAITFLNL